MNQGKSVGEDWTVFYWSDGIGCDFSSSASDGFYFTVAAAHRAPPDSSMDWRAASEMSPEILFQHKSEHVSKRMN